MTPRTSHGIRLALVAAGMVALAPALAQIPQGPFRAPSGGTGPPPRGALREAPTPPAPGSLYIREKPGNTLLATEYLGRAVHGPGKQKVGTISNLLVDTTGRVISVVIDVGGFLGIGSKEVAIAFEAVFPILENGKEAFVVELSKDQLAAAPAFKSAP